MNIKIQNKINFVKELYASQQGLLNENFNCKRLSTKYKNELKGCREKLFQRNTADLRSEIKRLNKLDIYGEKANKQNITNEPKLNK